MKIARYGTVIVILHALVNGLHGLAHLKVPVPLSWLQSSFVGTVIFPIPIVAAILLWTRFESFGVWLLFSLIAGSFLFGFYNHFLVISPDHVSQVGHTGWGMLFQVTAYLILIVDGFGCWMGLQALKALPQKEKFL